MRHEGPRERGHTPERVGVGPGRGQDTADLLGALVGAVLESMSFLLGVKALLLAVAFFYLVAAVTRPGAARLTATRPEPATD